jgi:hypothetical protein
LRAICVQPGASEQRVAALAAPHYSGGTGARDRSGAGDAPEEEPVALELAAGPASRRHASIAGVGLTGEGR